MALEYKDVRLFPDRFHGVGVMVEIVGYYRTCRYYPTASSVKRLQYLMSQVRHIYVEIPSFYVDFSWRQRKGEQ